MTGDALIAQKRAEIQAKMAALKANKPAVSSSAPGPLGVPNSSQFSREADTELQRRVEEAKKKVNAAKAKTALKDNHYLVSPPLCRDGSFLYRCSLLLLLQIERPLKLRLLEEVSRCLPIPFFSIWLLRCLSLRKTDTNPCNRSLLLSRSVSVLHSSLQLTRPQANARNAPTPPPVAPAPVESKTNPYASSSTAKDGDAPKDRASRSFRFNQKGKYTALGNQMRKDVRITLLVLNSCSFISRRHNWRL